jgi:heat shock protein HtpX
MILFAVNVVSDSNSNNQGGGVYYDQYGNAYQQPVDNSTQVQATPDPVAQTVSAAPYVAPFFFLGCGIWFVIAWIFNRDMVMALTHAQPLDRKSNPRIYNIVENLCISRGLPVPQIYIIDEPSMNAFASGLGPKNAMICFSRGIVEALNDQELEAVAGHELTHIMNNDIRLMLIAIIFVGIIQTIAWVFLRIPLFVGGNRRNGGGAAIVVLVLKLLAFVIGFFFAAVVQAAISRKREYLADAGSVELTKSSQPLISALEKISGNPHIAAVGNANVAQMFIENPLYANEEGFFGRLFDTHPPIADRIKALQQIG